MNWVEIIHLRLIGTRSPELIKDLLSQVLDLDQQEHSQKVKVYRHQNIEGDLSVVLECKSDGAVKAPSDLGLHLTSALREYGRVDFSAWIEM